MVRLLLPKNVKKEKGFHILYLFSLRITCVKLILSRRVANILHCSLPDTGHGMAVASFNGFSLTVYCIFVICHKSYPFLVLHFELYFQPGMPDFATAALLIRTEGA